MKAVLQNSDIVILLCLCYNKYLVEYTMIVNIKKSDQYQTSPTAIAKNMQQHRSGQCDFFKLIMLLIFQYLCKVYSLRNVTNLIASLIQREKNFNMVESQCGSGQNSIEKARLDGWPTQAVMKARSLIELLTKSAIDTITITVVFEVVYRYLKYIIFLPIVR